MGRYYGSASIIIDLNFEIKAESLEEAKEKILCAECINFELLNGENEKILDNYEMNNWYVVDTATQGNVQQSGINDFEIIEED